VKWFQHDTDMFDDDKITDLMMHFEDQNQGWIAYAIYNRCLEIVGHYLNTENATFIMPYDINKFSYKYNFKDIELLEKIFDALVECGLAERTENGLLRFPKIAKRLDRSTSQNPEMKKLLNNINVDNRCTEDVQPLKAEEKRIEKNRRDKKRIEENKNKKEYSPSVKLKLLEYEKLITLIGIENTKQCIEKLSDYIISKGLQKKYKDHYRTIRNWVIKEITGKTPYEWESIRQGKLREQEIIKHKKEDQKKMKGEVRLTESETQEFIRTIK